MVLGIPFSPGALSRAPYMGIWLLQSHAVSEISEVLCTRSGEGPMYGTWPFYATRQNNDDDP